MSEDSLKSSINNAVQATGQAAKFVGENIVLPMITAGTSLAATQLPKITKALNFLSAARPKKEEEKKDKTWLWILIIIIVIFIVLPLLAIATIGGAFLKITGLTPITVIPSTHPPFTPIIPQCIANRPQAEKVICWLLNGHNILPAKCSKSFEYVCIDPYLQVTGCVKELGIITDCLDASDIPGKERVVNEFQDSINASLVIVDEFSGKLQCVGFIKAVEASLGRYIGPPDIHTSCNAKDFFLNVDCRQDYHLISAAEIRAGDLAVRTTNKYGGPSEFGHISVINEILGTQEIIVAQADGYSGQVGLEKQVISNYSDSGGFLRYNY